MDTRTGGNVPYELLRSSAQRTAPSGGGPKERSAKDPIASGDAPLGPSRFRTWTAVLPFSLFSTDTTESAGWDTIAQNTPAVDTQQSSNSLSKLQIQLRN